MRGGRREGAGRPAKNTVVYYRRVQPDWVEILDKLINELKEKEKILNERGE